MPLYMDVHRLGEVSMDDVINAHKADLEKQGDRGVTYQRYWVDEDKGMVFCLVEAPTADDAVAVHRDAHGLVADEIYEVREGS